MPTRRALFAAATLATASFAGVAAPAHAVTANPGSDTRPAFGKGVPMRTNAVKARVAPNTYASTVPTVTTGSSWQNIRAVHYLLLARGIRVSAWETTYGPATRQAVLTFQRKYNLRGSGVALSGTIERLLAPVVKDQNTYRTYAIQTLLKRHGYQFGVQAAPPMNTFYDANTDRLVQTFQTAHGLGATTQTGPLTWATLFADRTSGPVYPPATTAHVTRPSAPFFTTFLTTSNASFSNVYSSSSTSNNTFLFFPGLSTLGSAGFNLFLPLLAPSLLVGGSASVNGCPDAAAASRRRTPARRRGESSGSASAAPRSRP